MIWNIKNKQIISEHNDILSFNAFYELIGLKLALSLREGKQIYTERLNGHTMISDYTFILDCEYKNKITDVIYKCEWVDINNAMLVCVSNPLVIVYSTDAREYWLR